MGGRREFWFLAPGSWTRGFSGVDGRDVASYVSTAGAGLFGGGFFFCQLAQCGHGGGGVVFAVFVFGAAFSLGGVVILRHRASWLIGGWGRQPGFVFEEIAVSSRFTWAVYPDGTKCGAGFRPTPGE